MAYSYPARPHAPPRVFPQIPAQDQDQVQKQERRKEKKVEGSALSTYGQWLRACTHWEVFVRYLSFRRRPVQPEPEPASGGVSTSTLTYAPTILSWLPSVQLYSIPTCIQLSLQPSYVRTPAPPSCYMASLGYRLQGESPSRNSIQIPTAQFFFYL